MCLYENGFFLIFYVGPLGITLLPDCRFAMEFIAPITTSPISMCTSTFGNSAISFSSNLEQLSIVFEDIAYPLFLGFAYQNCESPLLNYFFDLVELVVNTSPRDDTVAANSSLAPASVR